MFPRLSPDGARCGLAFALALALPMGAIGCADCNKGGGASADGGEPALVGDAAPPPGDGSVLNATPLPTASVAALLNRDNLPPYTGATGSIEGTVTVTGDPAPATPADFSRCPEAEQMWGHAFREGPRLPSGARDLADAVIVVTGYKGFFIPETHEAQEIRVEGCAYTQRTLAMTFGQRLEVKNLSKEFWTPVLEPGPNLVLMMATPMGDPAKIYPKQPRHYLLLDRDRKYSLVDVYALLQPLHATSSTTGYYRIDGVPVGKLKVSTTHPQIDSNAEQEVTVAAGVVQKVDLVLHNVSRDAGAAPVKDAGGAPVAPSLH